MERTAEKQLFTLKMIFRLALFFGHLTFLTPKAVAEKIYIGKAKIQHCLGSDYSECVLVVKIRSAALASGKGRLILSHRGQEFYSARKFKLLGQKQSTFRIAVLGEWNISKGSRQKAVGSGKVFSMVVMGSQRESDDDGFGDEGMMLASTGSSRASSFLADEDEGDELSGLSSSSSSMGGSSSMGSMNMKMDNSDDDEFTFESFKDWAMGADAEGGPVAALILRGGTPASPTGMMGAALEFYPNPILPVHIGFGEFNSTSMLKSSYGKIKQENAAIGTNLLLGRTFSKLSIGIDLVRINTKLRAASPQYLGLGLAPSAEAETATETPANSKVLVTKKENFVTTGFVPSLGFRFMSQSNFILTIDAGKFIGMGNKARYQEKVAKPLTKQAKGDPQGSQGMTSITLGLGVGF